MTLLRLYHGWSGYQGILFEYQSPFLYEEHLNLRTVSLSVSLLLHLSEGVIYGIIFHHCYTHDKSMAQILRCQIGDWLVHIIFIYVISPHIHSSVFAIEVFSETP